jgi:hypothetical protein
MTLPKVDTNCTAPSLIPTVNGNTVRSFSTHGQQSAAQGSSTTVSCSDSRTVPSAIHVRARRSTRPVDGDGRTDSLRLSTCAGNIYRYGTRELRFIAPTYALQHAIWRQCLSCNRVDEADGALTPTRNKPSFTPRRSGGRDESASHMNTELCACARARGPSRGRYREALLVGPGCCEARLYFGDTTALRKAAPLSLARAASTPMGMRRVGT